MGSRRYLVWGRDTLCGVEDSLYGVEDILLGFRLLYVGYLSAVVYFV